MVIKKVNLDIVVGVTSTLPETSFPEVAFAGKSNVGKSSLINALMNRKSYARKWVKGIPNRWDSCYNQFIKWYQEVRRP